ncbi:NDMA-dependent alcohol dehydrogenase [Rhodococcus erythropolis]
MQTRAAIIREAPGKFEVVDIELDEPRKNELLVRMVAAGMCHSDDHMRTADTVIDHYPMVMGHEGAGIVEAVGPDTEGWSVGDRVVFCYLPSCGKCRWCAEGMTNLCDLGATMLLGSRFSDPTSFRLRLPDGTEVGQNCGLGTLSERTVVSVDSAIKVPDDLELETICLLGCGVGTGWGSAVYLADVKPGDATIVMGTGGVGINAVQGAAHAGANYLVAVDPVELKRETALRLGATHAFADMNEAREFVNSVTNGQGADNTIVTVGVVHGDTIAEGFASVRKGGTVVVTGITPTNEVGIPISPFELTVMQKRIQGSMFGGCNPRADIPRQMQMYRTGLLELDSLVTAKYSLDDVNQGYDDMLAGKNIRGIVVF